LQSLGRSCLRYGIRREIVTGSSSGWRTTEALQRGQGCLGNGQGAQLRLGQIARAQEDTARFLADPGPNGVIAREAARIPGTVPYATRTWSASIVNRVRAAARSVMDRADPMGFLFATLPPFAYPCSGAWPRMSSRDQGCSVRPVRSFLDAASHPRIEERLHVPLRNATSRAIAELHP
jgi:hypothetical protein